MSAASGVQLRRSAAAASSSSSATPASSSSDGNKVPIRQRRIRRKSSKSKAKPYPSTFKFRLSGLREEVFHLALLGISLFTIFTVVVRRMLSPLEGYEESQADELTDHGTLGSKLRQPDNGPGLLSRITGAVSARLDGPLPTPDSMSRVGDKSNRYRAIRKEFDEEILPPDPDRTFSVVKSLRKREYGQAAQIEAYDIHNCPLYPLPGYPAQWPVLDVLDNWPTDDTMPRPFIYQGLCVFDYDTEFEKAKNYREAEVPFVIRDDPSVLSTAERWNHPGFMERLQGMVPHRTEYSPNNHFMYWMNPKKNPKGGKNDNQRNRKAQFPRKNVPIVQPEGWEPPTKLIRMPYTEWLQHANVSDDKLGPENPHWYYRLIGCGDMGKCDKDSSEYLFDEVPIFQPRDDNFYVVDPKRQKGIHCRFGMKGVTAGELSSYVS